MKSPKPKKEWCIETKRLFQTIVDNFHIMPEHLPTIVGTCGRHNRYHECETILKKEGLIFTSKSGQVKAHPLLTEQKNAWSGYLAGLRMLGLNNVEEKKRPAHRPVKGPGS